MINRILFIKLLIITLFAMGCSSKKNIEIQDTLPLYEILKQEAHGGNTFQFTEIVTNSKEFKMILNDPDLKKIVREDDIEKSNFLVLFLGERSTGGYEITVESVVEYDDHIEVKTKEIKPQDSYTLGFTYPMAVVKINSKKKIVVIPH